jgi:hypothetical protein
MYGEQTKRCSSCWCCVLTTCRPNAEREDSSSSGLDTLPSDHVYNWAAFNKLLLLGMYAPVEEAASPEGSQLAAQQLQEVAAAREVCVVAGTHATSMRTNYLA